MLITITSANSQPLVNHFLRLECNLWREGIFRVDGKKCFQFCNLFPLFLHYSLEDRAINNNGSKKS